MLRLFYALGLGLVGGALVHIAVLFMLPAFSERDAWTRLGAAATLYQVTRLDAQAGASPLVRPLDPLFVAAACRFDLADGPVRLSATGAVPFWSVSVYDRDGHNIYSFNDRTADAGVLDMLVLTPAQTIELRKAMPEQLQRSIFVEADIGEGIVVVRAFMPDDSWRQLVEAYLRSVACQPVEPAIALS